MLKKILAATAILLVVGACSRAGDRAAGPGTTTPDATRPSPDSSWDRYTDRARNGYSDRVFFGFDRYDLDSEARGSIEAWARWLQANPGATLLVEGHCDERGTREYNLALGARRAASVRNYLISLGVESNRIQTVSYGKERPAVAGSNENAWAQNRRGVAIPTGGPS